MAMNALRITESTGRISMLWLELIWLETEAVGTVSSRSFTSPILRSRWRLNGLQGYLLHVL